MSPQEVIAISDDENNLDQKSIPSIIDISDDADSDWEPTLPFGSDKRGKKARFVSHWDILPAYPDTHPDGHAHIVRLAEICTQDLIDVSASSLQYSLGAGGGASTQGVPNRFFADARMRHSTRKCMGVHACEYLNSIDWQPHRSVDENHIEWATRQAHHRSDETYSSVYQAQLFYLQWRDRQCPYASRSGRRCLGQTCIRTKESQSAYGVGLNPYIGCTEERRNEQHTYEPNIGHYDIKLLIKLFGYARVRMSNLEDYGGDFLFAKALPADEGAKPTCHDVFTNRQHGMFNPFIYACLLLT
jgi:hypothetical protein